MAKGDTKTNQYLDIAANGTRADLPTDTCCETRTQTLIRGVAERIMDVEDEVEEIKNNPDVVDIVATYADLQTYDTQHLTDKDIIRVLQDETHDGESTYYRYNKQSSTWTYVGESKQYTDFVGTDGTTAGTAGLVPAPATSDTDKYLKSDGTWATVSGGGGGTSDFDQLTNRPKYDNATMTGSTNIPKVPTATSELTNDSGFITSSALPTVNDATLTITQNGTSKGTFTANDADDTTIALTDTTYSDFTGTDGTAAGSAGLVPAPTTSDTDKYLKSDGTWATVSGGGGSYTAGDGINISAQDVISATNTGKAKMLTSADYNWPTNAPDGVALWMLEPGLYYAGSEMIGFYYYAGPRAAASNYSWLISHGTGGVTNMYTLFNGNSSSVVEVHVTQTSSGANYSNWGTHLLSGKNVVNNLTSNSTGNTLSAAQGKVLKGLIDSIAIRGAGAPTTSTVGSVGTLYEDTTNGDLYICTDATNPYVWEELGAGGGGSYTAGDGIDITNDVISATNTGKAKVLTADDYNWPTTGTKTAVALWLLDPGLYTVLDSSVVVKDAANSTVVQTGEVFLVSHSASGTVQMYKFNFAANALVVVNLDSSGNISNTKTYLSSSDVLQSTGTSTTSVMSQNAVTSMVYADPATKRKIIIGDGSSAGGADAVAIGYATNANSSSSGSIAMGTVATVEGAPGGVALGAGSRATVKGQMDIGCSSGPTLYGYNNSNYRLLTGLYDGQSAHDAATVGQITPTTDSSAPTASTAGRLGEIRIDTTDNSAYMCVVSDSTTPAYEWKKITA